MTGKERQRALAREKVQRQMARRAAQARRRRTVRIALASALAVVVVVALGAFGVTQLDVLGGDDTGTAAKAQPATAACSYTRPPEGQHGLVPRKVTVPSISGIPEKGTAQVVLNTNRGDIRLTLDQAAAPCTVHSFISLVKQDYFDKTECHRLTTGSLSVLQCGDPSGTGRGGPGYVFPDENLKSIGGPVAAGSAKTHTYPAGTVAMANSGPDTNGSQFFLVYKDSELQPNYTIFGHVTAGLDVVKKVASAGVAGGGNDGKPKEPVKIVSARVVSTSASPSPSVSPSASPKT